METNEIMTIEDIEIIDEACCKKPAIGTGAAVAIGAGLALAVTAGVKLVKKAIAKRKAKQAEALGFEVDPDFEDVDAVEAK